MTGLKQNFRFTNVVTKTDNDSAVNTAEEEYKVLIAFSIITS